jgi:pyruvate kinase
MRKQKYTLRQALIDFDSRKARTIYKKLSKQEYIDFLKDNIFEEEDLKKAIMVFRGDIDVLRK